MGTEIFGAYVKDEKLDIPSVPPGFESLTSFTLRRVEESTMITCSASSTASESQSAQTTTEIDCDSAKIIRSLRQRPWINHGHCNNNSEDEYEVDQLQQNLPARHGLPKGVIRGCPDCSNCQKVVARWRPEDACKPGVLDAPVFYPNEEEFEDTLEYISSIRVKAEQYGICRIVPPPSWKPPCSLKEKSVWECSKFGTRVQRIDKLQNRSSMRKLSKIQNNKRKRKKCMRMGVDCGVGSSNPSDHVDTGLSEADSFGFEPGPDFTLDTFSKYADDFKARYFSKSKTVRDMETNMSTPNEQWEPSPEIIEGEYWRMVEKPTEEIEVLYGADLETGTFSSGFPKMSNRFGSASDEKYIKSGWNLNNFPRLPGSVLSYESSDISGVLVPWLYIGMCFSSFCWHVEDHHLYSLNYLHWGAPKIWYGVPACDALKLETAMRKHLPDLFEEQPDLLHKLVTQLSPSILKSEGVPVYRCVQNPGEFVLTFPRAYHSGFNCGFNCAEAVNVAPIDWLPHGQIAVELYCRQGRRTSISHDKLLLGAAREAVKAHWELKLVKKNTVDNLRWKSVCGKDGILSKALKTRVEMERMRRDFLCSSTQATKMDISFDAMTERECAICLFDLHLSAAGCHCSPDRYVCLNHAKQLCGCAWSARFFLFRYDINELNILVEALEGKLSAVYRWARMDLGLALSSSVSKSNMQPQESVKLSSFSEGKIVQDVNLQGSVKPLEIVFALKHMKASPSYDRPLLETKKANHGSLIKKEESILPISNLSSPCCQVSKKEASYSGSPVAEKPEVNVILLSDDECQEPKKPISTLLTKHSEIYGNMAIYDDRRNPVLTPMSDAKTKWEGDATSLHNEVQNGSSPIKEEEDQHKGGMVLGSDFSCQLDSTNVNSNKIVNHFLASIGSILQPPMTRKPHDEDEHEKIETNDKLHIINHVNNLDKGFCQKGPRIAKTVRRINCNVEPVELGVVLSGKSWCNNQTIFPKGFKSRVRYNSVLDPTNMSYYVSEILDAGDRPLFMVSLEHCSSEVFIHVTPARCWEMVRERVNQEIAKQHKLGRKNLLPLQPPGSVDGFEMFGFSSAAIVQAVEALDRSRVCKEYWNSRPYSCPHVQISHTRDSGGRLNGQGDSWNRAVYKILGGLFKKANPEELSTLYSILNNDTAETGNGHLVIQLLREEIYKRGR